MKFIVNRLNYYLNGLWQYLRQCPESYFIEISHCCFSDRTRVYTISDIHGVFLDIVAEL